MTGLEATLLIFGTFIAIKIVIALLQKVITYYRGEQLIGT